MEYKQIRLNQEKVRIEFLFPFSMGMKNKIKALPDARYDGDERIWWLPVSEYSAKLAVKLGKDFGFLIDKSIMDLSRDFLFSKSDSVRKRMYPFQIAGLDFLHTTGGRAIIADEMGLGKTIEALGFIQERGFHSVLIVAPASVTYKWQAEIKSWVNSDADIITKGKQPLTNAQYTIMSYSIFTNKIEELRQHGYQLAVFDECHYLANRDTARTRAAKSLMTPYFLGLSGTPFLNKPIELFPQLNIISPGKWNSYWKFAMTYCNAHRERFGWVVDGASHLKELKEELKTYYLRRTKQEVLSELPSLTRVNMPVDYERELARQYSEAMDTLRKKISIGEGKRLTKLELIAELRQIIGHMKVLPSVELAENVLTSKKKVVLFAHHKAVVAELETKLQQYNPIKVVGDTSQKERADNVNKFLHDPEVRVAIISQAGGEGIDLYAADTLIFVEREWNPGKEGQIEARLHRIGQVSNVEAIYMIARGTIDERIHRMIEEKRNIFGQLISIDDIPVLDILEITDDR